jgi:hypothetical protein
MLLTSAIAICFLMFRPLSSWVCTADKKSDCAHRGLNSFSPLSIEPRLSLEASARHVFYFLKITSSILRREPLR